ncbi:hypothetical protein LT493_23415 [Streptomyces tricolor]|nr:hypothetical protein [Streptomyces tricolor]
MKPWTPDSSRRPTAPPTATSSRKLRTRYGTGTTLVAVGTGQFAAHVQQVVKARNDAGDRGVRYWFLDDTGLDFQGCHWHLLGPRRPTHRRPPHVPSSRVCA